MVWCYVMSWDRTRDKMDVSNAGGGGEEEISQALFNMCNSILDAGGVTVHRQALQLCSCKR